MDCQPEEHVPHQHTLQMHPKFMLEQTYQEQQQQQTQPHGFSIPLLVQL